ncbi:MAG: hypothetical protein V4510_09780 [bacterium]
MSGGLLPASYDAWRTATPWDDEPEHVKTCPRHEDNHDGEPADCTCPTPAEIAAERAEDRSDRGL